MPIYTVELDGKTYDIEGGDTPPTEQDARAAVGAFNGGEQSPIFTPAPLEDLSEKPSPLNTGQNIMLGLMADEVKPLYLAKEFQGKNVQQDDKGGFTVDGAPVNPQGFDMGDILRSLGYAAPFAGQVAGSLAGAGAASTVAPGAGTLAGGFAGGVAGATAGEAARLGAGKFLLSAMGKNLELNNEGQIYLNALSENAKYAAAGETLGLGLVGGGQVAKRGVDALSKTQLYQGAADVMSKTVNRLKGNPMIEDILQFVGQIPKDATKIVLRDKPSKVLSPEYFDSDKTSKIASKTIFGTDDFYTLGATNENGVPKGAVALAKSIKEVNDPAYDQLLQTLGIGDDFIKSLRASNVDSVLKSVNTTNRPNVRSFELATRSINEIKTAEKALGKEVSRAEMRAIHEKGSVYFYAEDLVKRIDGIIGSGELLKPVNVPGFKPSAPPNIPGAEQLKQLSDIFKGMKDGGESKMVLGKNNIFEFSKVEKEAAKKAYGKIPTKQLLTIKRQFDGVVDGIFANQRIPSEIKNQVRLISKDFRTKYYDYLGIGKEVEQYKMFKELTDGFNVEGPNAIAALENKISNFKSASGSAHDDFAKAMSSIQSGNKIIKEIEEFNLAQQIKAINPNDLLKSLASPLSSQKYLRTNTTDSAIEGILRDISKRMGAMPGSPAFKRQFAEEAERALAAKEFLKSNQNMLRLSSLAGMAGLGALGGSQFGVPGAIGGAALSLSLFSPKTLGGLLIASEKNGPRMAAAGRGIRKSVVLDSKKRALLTSLLSQRLKNSDNESGNNNKTVNHTKNTK